MSAEQFVVRRTPEVESRVAGGLSSTESPEDEHVISVNRYSPDEQREADCRINYKLGTFEEEVFVGPVPNRVLDLLEIAVATFAADKYVEREIRITENDSDDRINTRNIKLHIPVITQSFSTTEIETLFGEMVSHMTRDVVEYEFVQQDAVEEPSIQERFETTTEAVSLLSDGLDSTGGVFYNRDQNIDSAYVTVNYGRGLSPTVETIAEQANTTSSPLVCPVEYGDNMDEYTQFSRGLLHLSFGAATAIAYGVDTIQCFENGIMAQFVILQDGWQTTRTVSPHLLQTFNHILELALPDSLRVTNPFRMDTKTEIVNRIPQTDLVRETVSCPHNTRYDFAEQDNCGLCVPCLIRNSAIIASDHEIPARELGVHNSFAADFANRELQGEVEVANNAANSPGVFFRAFAEIAYFCRQIQQTGHETFALEYPELHSPPVYDLHKRFAANFTAALEEVAERNETVRPFLST